MGDLQQYLAALQPRPEKKCFHCPKKSAFTVKRLLSAPSSAVNAWQEVGVGQNASEKIGPDTKITAFGGMSRFNLARML